MLSKVSNLPMSEVVYKKSRFSKQTIKLTVKVCRILHTRPTGTQNQDSRSLLNSFRCHEFISDLINDKQAYSKNRIF